MFSNFSFKMKSIFIYSLTLISFCVCRPRFCDVGPFDMVFNVGHIIHMIRCAEVWNWDPRMHNSKGAMVRDYSWFAFARSLLFDEYITKHGKPFNVKFFRFAALSIQEVQCEDPWLDLERDCAYSTREWSTFSQIISNESVYTFKYVTETPKELKDFPNPMDLKAKIKLSEKRLTFYPSLSRVAAHYLPSWQNSHQSHPNDATIRSVLFFKKDFRLFVVLHSYDLKYYCLTHRSIKKMVFDVREWPQNIEGEQPEHRWADPYCWSGYLIGMFDKDDQVYIVGHILETSREFNDQVYLVKAVEDQIPEIRVLMIDGYNQPHNLRTFFGCRANQSLKNGIKKDIDSLCTKRRRRRSLQNFSEAIDFIWDDMKNELREDWLLLTFMSFIALFLTFIIFKIK